MNPILYENTEDSFLTNGLGRLTDALSCLVTEERNGKYELEMIYPATGIHFDSLQNGRILYARHSDGLDLQPFRIYKITKPLNGKVAVFAHHISYDLSKLTVMPFAAETCAEALAGIESFMVGASKFAFWTDKATQAHFEVTVPTAARSALGGKEGSVLDTFGGGEYEFDHFIVKLHAQRGTDSGVTIRYGKNMRDFTQELDAENVITGVAPYWQATSEDKTVVTLPEGAVIAASSASGVLTEYYWDENSQIYRDENGEGYETEAETLGIVPLDLSNYFDEQPTVAQLRAAAVAYLRSSVAQLEESESIKVSFAHLWQTEEYKNVAPLQRLRLCDTANIYYPRYEVSVTAKVVRTVYNVLLERYDSMELGDARSTLAKTLNGQNLKIESVKKEVEDNNASMMAAAIDHATQMITGGLGGHVILKQNADGEPEEILVMDTDDTATAVNVIRINRNGIAFSRNGYNGMYSTGWMIDGTFVADFITAGTLNANLIKAGTMSADRILGGTMKLGGSGNNKNGVLEIFNGSDQRTGRWDSGNLYLGNIAGSLTNPNTKIASDGTITTKKLNASGGGTIGGFTIGTSSLYNGKSSLSDTTYDGVYLGTNGIALGKGKFKVTKAGAITAISGNIGGFTLSDSKLYNGKSKLSDTTYDGVYIGTDGIALGKGTFKVTKAGVLTVKAGTIKLEANKGYVQLYKSGNNAMFESYHEEINYNAKTTIHESVLRGYLNGSQKGLLNLAAWYADGGSHVVLQSTGRLHLKAPTLCVEVGSTVYDGATGNLRVAEGYDYTLHFRNGLLVGWS